MGDDFTDAFLDDVTPVQADDSMQDIEGTKKDLLDFISQPGPREEPPCPSCNFHEPMTCSPKCKDVAKSLSIEPDRYPIEMSAVPVVFELMATRVMQTCWSCEGHFQDGELWKTPQISFHAKQPIYPYLLKMQFQRRNAF